MAAARAALICPLATAPVMGTTVNQRAAMVVASPNFVVALANNFATIPKVIAGLSGFGAMSSSWPRTLVHVRHDTGSPDQLPARLSQRCRQFLRIDSVGLHHGSDNGVREGSRRALVRDDTNSSLDSSRVGGGLGAR